MLLQEWLKAVIVAQTNGSQVPDNLQTSLRRYTACDACNTRPTRRATRASHGPALLELPQMRFNLKDPPVDWKWLGLEYLVIW